MPTVLSCLYHRLVPVPLLGNLRQVGRLQLGHRLQHGRGALRHRRTYRALPTLSLVVQSKARFLSLSAAVAYALEPVNLPCQTPFQRRSRTTRIVPVQIDKQPLFQLPLPSHPRRARHRPPALSLARRVGRNTLSRGMFQRPCAEETLPVLVRVLLLVLVS